VVQPVKGKKSSRPKLPKVSEEMKAWSAALADEVAGWPQVTARPFFGFTALYRRETMFAALPRTRGWETANSLAFKLGTNTPAVSAGLKRDSRLRTWPRQIHEARWITFELSSAADIHEALDWLGHAYEAAAKSKKSQ
jgi:hypothetical protein